MVKSRLRTSGMTALIRNGALCAVSFGGGGGGGLHELGPLALLVAGFAGVGMWMFRRYGGGAKRQAPTVEPQPDRAPGAGALTGHPA